MPRGRKLKSYNDFKKALKKGYGLGSFSDYRPWLDSSTVNSDQESEKIQGLKVSRPHHTLSSLETELFFLLEHNDNVVDIREQFPLLPIDLSLKTAQALGIDHPVIPFVSEKFANIITTDFFVTFLIKGKTVYKAISVKAYDALDDIRTLEKQELERVCWQLLGISFKIYTGSSLTKLQSKNIRWFTDPLRHGFKCSDEQLDKMLSCLQEGFIPIQDILQQAHLESGLDKTEALCIFKTLLAKKIVLVDLCEDFTETGIVNLINVSK